MNGKDKGKKGPLILLVINDQNLDVMKKIELYEPPCIERVVVFLEHAIAGSTGVNVGGGFTESWEEERIDTGDIVLM